MKKLRGVLEGLGLLFFILGISGMDSEGTGIFIAIAMFFGGMLLFLVGQSLPELSFRLKERILFLRGGKYYEQSHFNR